jgi:hypothetical protein
LFLFLSLVSIDNDNDRSSKPRFQTDINPSASDEIKNPITDNKQLPADVRLNMLTGIPTIITKSSTSKVGERSKDALNRINELIQQTSVLDIDNKINDDDNDVLLSSTKQDERLKSDGISPIQFYINETNKLTSNLESSISNRSIGESEQDKTDVTNMDNMNIQQVNEFLINTQLVKFMSSSLRNKVMFGNLPVFDFSTRQLKEMMLMFYTLSFQGF